MQKILASNLPTKIIPISMTHQNVLYLFFATSPIRALISAHMYFASYSHRWRGLDFFLNSYAATENQTHVSSVAPL